jgi:hypothetical protein
MRDLSSAGIGVNSEVESGVARRAENEINFL